MILFQCKLLNISYEFEGDGYANSQSIVVGTNISSTDKLKVTFEGKYNFSE